MTAVRTLALYQFLVTATFGFLQPFLPLYMEASGLRKDEIGWVMGLSIGIALLMQPLWGWLSDRWDHRRPFIALCALLAGMAYLGFPFVEGTTAFLLLGALGANGTLYLTAVGGVLVGRMVVASQGGAAYSQIRVWGSVGYIVVSVVSGLVVTLRGPLEVNRQALDLVFLTGPWMFIAIAGLSYWLPDRRNEVSQVGDAVRGPLPTNLRNFLWCYFFYSLALYGSSPYLSLYMKSLGASGIWITGMFAMGVVVEVLVMRRSGALSDVYGRRPLLALSFLLLPIRLILYMPAMNPAWVAGVQLLHGINFGIVGAVAIVFVNDLATDATHGRSQARLSTVAGLSMAVGPMIFGIVAEAIGLRGMFGIAALFAAIGAAILLLGVEDSHLETRSVADRGPGFLRPVLRWLDAPVRRKGTDNPSAEP
jgi:PPP family 3-phenylpropionic acid transporter